MLKQGFIFIPSEGHELPASYCARHCGGIGFFARLDPGNINGYDPVTVTEYEASPAAGTLSA